MQLRPFFFNLILNMLLFHFIARLFNVTLPSNFLYFLICLAMVAGAVMIHKPLRNFLTLRSNFFINVVMIGLLVLGVLYLADFMIPEFSVEPLYVNGTMLGAFVVSEFTIGKYALMFIIGMVMALGSSLLNYLRS